MANLGFSYWSIEQTIAIKPQGMDAPWKKISTKLKTLARQLQRQTMEKNKFNILFLKWLNIKICLRLIGDSIRGLRGCILRWGEMKNSILDVFPHYWIQHLNINTPAFSFTLVFADKRAESSHIKTSAVIQKLLLRVTLPLWVRVLVFLSCSN